MINLGQPDELFYWGPSRGTILHMGDFIAAAEIFFDELASDDSLPNPPEMVVLFHNNYQMVWLINQQAFAEFTAQVFVSYKEVDRLKDDISCWEAIVARLPELDANEHSKGLLEAWHHTLFPEFALYGASQAVAQMLSRFEADDRQRIWGAFTVPDELGFMQRIDVELIESKDPEAMANLYPWMQDGYGGVNDDQLKYFENRLKVLMQEDDAKSTTLSNRDEVASKYDLTDDELEALNLARELAQFMDRRKEWMMQSRRQITEPLSKVEYGWHYKDGKSFLLSLEEAEDLWNHYVKFDSGTQVISGMVACNGSRHNILGEVSVVASPTDDVPKDKIMVVPSTSPSYVHLMIKARAIVTDHGGMMSHAAILARELNVPCIVGTHEATKKLKDGDVVVLDLVSGEITRQN